MKGLQDVELALALHYENQASVIAKKGRTRITIARDRQYHLFPVSGSRSGVVHGVYIVGRESGHGLRDRSRKPHLRLGGRGIVSTSRGARSEPFGNHLTPHLNRKYSSPTVT